MSEVIVKNVQDQVPQAPGDCEKTGNSKRPLFPYMLMTFCVPTENSKNEESILGIRPSQVCSPMLARPVLSAPRLNQSNVRTPTKSCVLRPSQLGGNVGSAAKASFALSPSRLNSFGSKAASEQAETNHENSK